MEIYSSNDPKIKMLFTEGILGHGTVMHWNDKHKRQSTNICYCPIKQSLVHHHHRYLCSTCMPNSACWWSLDKNQNSNLGILQGESGTLTFARSMWNCRDHRIGWSCVICSNWSYALSLLLSHARNKPYLFINTPDLHASELACLQQKSQMDYSYAVFIKSHLYKVVDVALNRQWQPS